MHLFEEEKIITTGTTTTTIRQNKNKQNVSVKRTHYTTNSGANKTNTQNHQPKNYLLKHFPIMFQWG